MRTKRVVVGEFSALRRQIQQFELVDGTFSFAVQSNVATGWKRIGLLKIAAFIFWVFLVYLTIWAMKALRLRTNKFHEAATLSASTKRLSGIHQAGERVLKKRVDAVYICHKIVEFSSKHFECVILDLKNRKEVKERNHTLLDYCTTL